jgi:hypothetical protein
LIFVRHGKVNSTNIARDNAQASLTEVYEVPVSIWE